MGEVDVLYAHLMAYKIDCDRSVIEHVDTEDLLGMDDNSSSLLLTSRLPVASYCSVLLECYTIPNKEVNDDVA